MNGAFKITSVGFESSNIDTTLNVISAVDTTAEISKTGMSATASFTEGGNVPNNAIDSSTSTRWASNGDSTAPNGWIAIDLGGSYTLTKLSILWEGAYASGYKIQYKANSTDSEWTDIQTITGGNGGTDDVTFYSALTCTNIRILGQTMATIYAMSIWNIDFFGGLNSLTSYTKRFLAKIQFSSSIQLSSSELTPTVLKINNSFIHENDIILVNVMNTEYIKACVYDVQSGSCLISVYGGNSFTGLLILCVNIIT